MDIKIFDTPELVLAQRESWQALLERTTAANPFLTPEWLSTWYRFYGDRARLLVIGVYKGPDLIGLAPLLIEQRRLYGIPVLVRIRSLGVGLSDRLDILAAGGHEREVLGAITAQVFRRDWDVWDLDELREDSATAKLLPEVVKHFPANVEITRQSTCPVVELAGDVATFRSLRSNDFWKTIDYYERRLGKEHTLEIRFHDGGAELAHDLESFLELYRAAFASRPSLLTEQRFADFRRRVALEMAARGHLLLALLYMDGRPVSGQLCFRYGQTCYAYNLCHDPACGRQSVGTVLQWAVLRHLIEHGYRRYDFLRGVESYKYRWGAVPVHQQRIRIWRDKHKVRLLQATLRLKRRPLRARSARPQAAAL